MRILHLSALPVWSMGGKGGMPSLRETLLGHLRHGHEIVLVLPKYDLFSDNLAPLPVEHGAGYVVHVAPCRWLPPMKTFRGWARKLRPGKDLSYVLRWALNIMTFAFLTFSLMFTAARLRYRERITCSLIYAHNQYASLAGWLLAMAWRVPNVTRLYGTFLADLMKRPLVWLRYPVAAAGYLVPHDLLICCNDGTRGDEVARKLRIDLSRFRFWQNGVDLPTERPRDTRAGVVARFPTAGLRPDSRWILSCSRLSYWKRIDRILHAMKYCREHGCDCLLVVAGEGPERERLQALAKELGIENDVAWLGGVSHDEIWALMNLADVFMITNDVTNRCNPLYESMCAGVPVVSVRDVSSADLVEHNVNALLADRDDVDGLGECLRKVLTDPELGDRLRAAQLERAAGLWSWEERMNTEVRELERLVMESERGKLRRV